VTPVSWQEYTHSQSDNGIQTEVDKKNYADTENNKNILFCTGIFWVGQMHYGPPKEIFGWAMAHPKYRVAPPMIMYPNTLLDQAKDFLHN
jgi:hypothetical protein